MLPFRLPRGAAAPRLLFVLPVLLLAGGGTALVSRAAPGLGAVRWPFLLLLAVNLVALALSCWPTVLGMLALLLRRGPALRPAVPPGASTGHSRTAVVLPVYNEDPAQVFAAVEVMADAIRAAALPHTELFVLSDTRDPALIRAEEDAHARLRARGVRVTYRRRVVNSGRKVGNIADFLHRWGDDYDYMLVLDADSLMTAEAVGRLIGLMDANPRAGLIQSVPYAVNRETLFARWQQFAMRLYTPLWAAGMALWHGASGNYWGHNAILRIQPFRDHCHLPVLPGRPPFGGEILCHDVVEAALLRRAGWDVWVLPDLPGSFEEMPANLVDYAGRERRWCQGNLQHLRVLPAPGLRGPSRLHLLTGILHYASGLTWTAMAALLLCAPGGAVPAATAVSALVLGFVLVPKVLSVGAALLHPEAPQRWGGRGTLLLSALAEQVLTTLSAPVTLVFYARFVATLLLGRAVGWDAQPRHDRGVSWAEAWQRLRLHALLGLGVAAAVLLFNPALLLPAAPVLAGLLAAVPFAVAGSRLSAGRLARRLGLFLTEDELAPPRELRLYRAALLSPEPPRRPALRPLPELLVEAAE